MAGISVDGAGVLTECDGLHAGFKVGVTAAATSEMQGYADPWGSGVRVCIGTSTGKNILTRKKPIPTGEGHG